MRLSRLISALAVCAVATFAAAPAWADVLISVDKSTQTMSVMVDGAVRYVWPVSTGAPGYDTPSGNFKPFRMEEDHFSKEWDDAPMPHSIFFTQSGIAVHGTYETKRLGLPVSHGCVRLSPAHATTLFDLVKQEGLLTTKVVLTGSEQVALAQRALQKRQLAGAATDDAPMTMATTAARTRVSPASDDAYASSNRNDDFVRPLFANRPTSRRTFDTDETVYGARPAYQTPRGNSGFFPPPDYAEGWN